MTGACLDPKGHRALLDAFAGLAPLIDTTRETWRARSRLAKRLAEAEAALAAVRAEEEYLRHAVAELDAMDPQPGEEAELDARRRLMQGAERMREDMARAHAALGPQGAEGAMGDALRWLDGLADRADGMLDSPLEALGRAMNELAEAVQGVERAQDVLSFNPHELEETEERLFAIRALARKHDVLADDLGQFAAGLRDRLVALGPGRRRSAHPQDRTG